MMRLSLCILTVVTALFATSCGPSTAEDFQDAGQRHVRDLVLELEKLDDREQLERRLPYLRKSFSKLVDVMIAAQGVQAGKGLGELKHGYSDRLRAELIRIYGIEGGRELVELAQEEGLSRLVKYRRDQELHSQRY